jgi:hypothetical protein
MNKVYEMCTPWDASHYYLINGVKYAYEAVAGLDFIWLYDGGGKMFVGDVQAAGYLVTKPKVTRAYVQQQAKTKMPSAGSISYYKDAA